MPPVPLHDLDEALAEIARTPRALLFKHSPVCPVSAAALAEWEAFLGAEPDVAALFVDVVGDRPVARGLADAVGVPHASPQAILFEDGEATWSASHGDITAASLAAAWRGAAS